MVQHSGGPVSPTDEHDRESSGSRPMLGEREVAQMAQEVSLRAVGAAVARA
eukprot:SAG11_NODE_3515_length_2398_cov_7.547629_4_plen_51_part_00